MGWKTLWEKEKMLVTSIFSFFPRCFQNTFTTRAVKTRELLEILYVCIGVIPTPKMLFFSNRVVSFITVVLRETKLTICFLTTFLICISGESRKPPDRKFASTVYRTCNLHVTINMRYLLSCFDCDG